MQLLVKIISTGTYVDFHYIIMEWNLSIKDTIEKPFINDTLRFFSIRPVYIF